MHDTANDMMQLNWCEFR